MKVRNVLSVLPIVLILAVGSSALAGSGIPYTPKGEHRGGDVTPREAYDMAREDPDHAFLVDVRTRYEYQDIGHPVGAYNIPYMFYTTRVDDRGYAKVVNRNFCDDLRARFNPESDTLIMVCRSGERAIHAATAAVECGFGETRVYAMMGGFEGDKVKDTKSPDYGTRKVNGWRIENLPWTYRMDRTLMYQPDLK